MWLQCDSNVSQMFSSVVTKLFFFSCVTYIFVDIDVLNNSNLWNMCGKSFSSRQEIVPIFGKRIEITQIHHTVKSCSLLSSSLFLLLSSSLFLLLLSSSSSLFFSFSSSLFFSLSSLLSYSLLLLLFSLFCSSLFFSCLLLLFSLILLEREKKREDEEEEKGSPGITIFFVRDICLENIWLTLESHWSHIGVTLESPILIFSDSNVTPMWLQCDSNVSLTRKNLKKTKKLSFVR